MQITTALLLLSITAAAATGDSSERKFSRRIKIRAHPQTLRNSRQTPEIPALYSAPSPPPRSTSGKTKNEPPQTVYGPPPESDSDGSATTESATEESMEASTVLMDEDETANEVTERYLPPKRKKISAKDQQMIESNDDFQHEHQIQIHVVPPQQQQQKQTVNDLKTSYGVPSPLQNKNNNNEINIPNAAPADDSVGSSSSYLPPKESRTFQDEGQQQQQQRPSLEIETPRNDKDEEKGSGMFHSPMYPVESSGYPEVRDNLQFEAYGVPSDFMEFGDALAYNGLGYGGQGHEAQQNSYSSSSSQQQQQEGARKDHGSRGSSSSSSTGYPRGNLAGTQYAQGYQRQQHEEGYPSSSGPQQHQQQQQQQSLERRGPQQILGQQSRDEGYSSYTPQGYQGSPYQSSNQYSTPPLKQSQQTYSTGDQQEQNNYNYPQPQEQFDNTLQLQSNGGQEGYPHSYKAPNPGGHYGDQLNSPQGADADAIIVDAYQRGEGGSPTHLPQSYTFPIQQSYSHPQTPYPQQQQQQQSYAQPTSPAQGYHPDPISQSVHPLREESSSSSSNSAVTPTRGQYGPPAVGYFQGSFPQPQSQVRSNSLDLAGEMEELEGLNGRIVDAALLEKVQKIIEEHEREQKAALSGGRTDPHSNYNNQDQQLESRSGAASSGGYPPYPAEGQANRERSKGNSHEGSSKANVEYQRAILSHEFTEETTEKQELGGYSSHFPSQSPRPSYGVPLAPVIGLDSNENFKVVEDVGIGGGNDYFRSSRGGIFYGRNRRRVGIVTRLDNTNSRRYPGF